MNKSQLYKYLLKKIDDQVEFLPDKPKETPQTTLEALWYFSCKKPYRLTEVEKTELPDLIDGAYNKLMEMIDKRIKGIPLAHLTGKKEFMGVDFSVDSSALIPRKETEILGYAALKIIRDIANKQNDVKVIDVCTGMGNLALAFAIHEPKCYIKAADISEEAIKLAKENLYQLSLNDKVEFFAGDLLSPFPIEEYANKTDVITCNPPYISTGKLDKMPEEIINHEPQEAFDGGPMGLNIIFRLIRESIPFIRDGGWLCFEVGLGQGEGIIKIVERNQSYHNIQSAKDNNGNIRAILAQVKK